MSDKCAEKQVYWKHHKPWLRLMVQRGLTVRAAAAMAHLSEDHAHRVIKNPRVKKYLESLYRWHADKALQARIETEIGEHRFTVPYVRDAKFAQRTQHQHNATR